MKVCKELRALSVESLHLLSPKVSIRDCRNGRPKEDVTRTEASTSDLFVCREHETINIQFYDTMRVPF